VLGNRGSIAFTLEQFALIAAAQHQYERCLRLAGAAAALRERAGVAATAAAAERLEAGLAPVRSKLGQAAAAAWNLSARQQGLSRPP
jgi:hypothetical protein